MIEAPAKVRSRTAEVADTFCECGIAGRRVFKLLEPGREAAEVVNRRRAIHGGHFRTRLVPVR